VGAGSWCERRRITRRAEEDKANLGGGLGFLWMGLLGKYGWHPGEPMLARHSIFRMTGLYNCFWDETRETSDKSDHIFSQNLEHFFSKHRRSYAEDR
jgi:hypothetical protein